MNILVAHNYYQQRGGEDQVFADECNLLERYGHQVYRYTLHNDQIETLSPRSLLVKTIWNWDVYREMRSLLRQHQIQIVHFHNTFPLISPAAYYAAKAEGIPVLQTCHNYRLLCPNAMFLRDGLVCENCLGKAIPLPAVRYGCYRGSQTASAAVATTLAVHRLAQTWTRQVDVYIALTQFAQQKFIQGGIPSKKIVVKSNFVYPDPGIGTGQGGYALFVGRLSQEKGVDLLLTAWQQLGTKIPLKIVGDGPLAPQVATSVAQNPNITWLGRRPMDDVYALMKEAKFLVFPSRWYEGLPRTLIESFAVGTPVITANLGSMSSLVTPHRTGFHFQSGSSEDLTTTVSWALENPQLLSDLRHSVRAEFQDKYTAEKSYYNLLEIYTNILRTSNVKELAQL